jgi:Ca2+-binding EF-hand superfamily protein
MKTFIMTLSLAAIVTAQIPSALAQDASAKAQEMFTKADTNQDGVLSLEEWKAAGRRDRGFSMIDANKDGKVTPDELRAAAAKRGK